MIFASRRLATKQSLLPVAVAAADRKNGESSTQAAQDDVIGVVGGEARGADIAAEGCPVRLPVAILQRSLLAGEAALNPHTLAHREGS